MLMRLGNEQCKLPCNLEGGRDKDSGSSGTVKTEVVAEEKASWIRNRVRRRRGVLMSSQVLGAGLEAHDFHGWT